MMKLNLQLAPDDPLLRELEALGIEHDPAAAYVVRKKTKETAYLPARQGEAGFYLDVRELLYAESMGHDVLLHTADGTYHSADRLKQLEKVLDGETFLRISNSCIVNLKQVKRIESSLLQKFILHLSDGSRVDVTRTYYYIFKERLGI